MTSKELTDFGTKSERDWTIESTPEAVTVTFRTNADFRFALTHHAAALFAMDLEQKIDPQAAQITFRGAVEQDQTMTPEQKAYWLSVCDEEGK